MPNVKVPISYCQETFQEQSRCFFFYKSEHVTLKPQSLKTSQQYVHRTYMVPFESRTPIQCTLLSSFTAHHIDNSKHNK